MEDRKSMRNDALANARYAVRRAGLVMAGAALIAGQALAQEALPAPASAPAWERADLGDDRAATIVFPDRPTVSVRCSDRQLVVLISGLPTAGQAERTRGVMVRQGGRTLSMPWIAGASDEAVAGAPSPLARALRRGGPISVSAPSDGGEVRYDLDFPADAPALTEVMQHCATPLEDARDDLPPLDITAMRWTREPEPPLPGRLRQNGLAVISCVTVNDGHLRDCRVESEFPIGYEVGRAAVMSYREANIGRKNGGVVPDGQVVTAALRVPCQRCVSRP